MKIKRQFLLIGLLLLIVLIWLFLVNRQNLKQNVSMDKLESSARSMDPLEIQTATKYFLNKK